MPVPLSARSQLGDETVDVNCVPLRRGEYEVIRRGKNLSWHLPEHGHHVRKGNSPTLPFVSTALSSP